MKKLMLSIAILFSSTPTSVLAEDWKELRERAIASWQSGQLRSALDEATRAKSMLERLDPENSAEIGKIYTLQGLIAFELGEYESAWTWHTLAGTMAIEAFGLRSSEYGTTLSNASMASDALGRNKEALQEADSAIEILSDPINRDQIALAKALANRASALLSLAQYDEAEASNSRAVAILMAHPEATDRERSDALNNLGNVRILNGNLVDAIAPLQRSLELMKAQGPENPAAIPTLVNLANAKRRLGQLDAARSDIAEAERIGEIALPKDHPDLIRMTFAKGALLFQVGEVAGAEEALKACALMAARVGESQDQQLKECVAGLKALYVVGGRDKEAQAAEAFLQSVPSRNP